jgi:putative redox protein
MHASAQRINGFRHVVKVREHRLNCDEGKETGGDDAAPSPQELLAASLASCTAVTIEMYADRGCPTKFVVTLRLPSDLTEEQVQRLKVIATKCPVHRTLDGEVMFDERVERIQLAV